MSLRLRNYEGSEIVRALEIRKEQAIGLESAKFHLVSVNAEPEVLQIITNKYKSLIRLIKWLESKLEEY